MTVSNELKTLLTADATLTALLGSRIYTNDELGKQGIDKDNSVTSASFTLDDGYYVLLPTLVIRQRGEIPSGSRSDTIEQSVAVNQVVELWFYDQDNYTTIRSARDRCYDLLQFRTMANVGALSLVNSIDGLRDESLNDAALLRADFRTTRNKGA